MKCLIDEKLVPVQLIVLLSQQSLLVLVQHFLNVKATVQQSQYKKQTTDLHNISSNSYCNCHLISGNALFLS